MGNERIVTMSEDGDMLCPLCRNRLVLCLSGHTIRKFTAKIVEDVLIRIGDPLDSEVIEEYDEYLFCPGCKTRHSVPDTEEGDTPEDDWIEHEGDLLAATALINGKPVHICPRCGKEENEEAIVYLIREGSSQWEIDQEESSKGELVVRETSEDTFESDDHGHLLCNSCGLKWSFPTNTKIDWI